MLREVHVYDAEDIYRKIDAYCMDTMQSNAQHGALPFFLATFPFAALFTTFGSPLPLFLWLAAVTIISGLRLFFASKYWRSEHRADAQWMRINITLLAILGCLFGLTPFVFPAADKTWLFAVSNLRFAGLQVCRFGCVGDVVARHRGDRWFGVCLTCNRAAVLFTFIF